MVESISAILLLAMPSLTNHPDQSTSKLRGVMVPIVDQYTCKRAHAAYMTVQPRMLCAGDFVHDDIDGQQISYFLYRFYYDECEFWQFFCLFCIN